MLVRLTVENFALLERCDIEFAEGFNALTGQTGAGKSLLIDALVSILGARVSVDSIRKGCESGLVEAFFQIDDAVLADMLAGILSVPLENGELLLRRTLSRRGRSTAEANGRSIPIAALRAAGDILVDIHGQNEHQQLLSNAVQMALLDIFAGLQGRAERFTKAHSRLKTRVDELRRLDAERESLERERDFLEHRVGELEAAALKDDGELDDLLSRREMAANHQQVTDVVTELHRRLYDSDGSVASVIERLITRLSRLDGLSSEIDRWEGLLEEAKVLGVG